MLLALLLVAQAALPKNCVEVNSRRVCWSGKGDSLVVYLHGYGGHGSDDTLGLGRLSEQAGYVYAAPDAVAGAEGRREWRDSDVEFLATLIDRIRAVTHVKKVFVAGFSLGGFLALEEACTHPERLSAVASIGGTRLAPARGCAGGAVSVLQLHGADDPVVSPQGGIGKRLNRRYLSAMAAATAAAEADGCTDVARDTQALHASQCRGGARVELRIIPGLGHAPPPDAAHQIWDFFSRAPAVPRATGRP